MRSTTKLKISLRNLIDYSSALKVNESIEKKNLSHARIEPPPKNTKRIARAHDPIGTLSQNGYGDYYGFMVRVIQ